MLRGTEITKLDDGIYRSGQRGRLHSLTDNLVAHLKSVAIAAEQNKTFVRETIQLQILTVTDSSVEKGLLQLSKMRSISLSVDCRLLIPRINPLLLKPQPKAMLTLGFPLKS